MHLLSIVSKASTAAVQIYIIFCWYIFRFNEKTHSLWGYIWSRLDDFKNPLFEIETEDYLVPKTEVSLLR